MTAIVAMLEVGDGPLGLFPRVTGVLKPVSTSPAGSSAVTTMPFAPPIGLPAGTLAGGWVVTTRLVFAVVGLTLIAADDGEFRMPPPAWIVSPARMGVNAFTGTAVLIETLLNVATPFDAVPDSDVPLPLTLSVVPAGLFAR